MQIISSREFRANQKSYFEKVDNGEDIIIQRKGNKSYKITLISEDDTLINKKELSEKINTSLKQINEGKYISLANKQEIDKLLNEL